MQELAELAEMIMERVIGSPANAILVSAVKLTGIKGRGAILSLLEGSIALDPYIRPRIFRRCVTGWGIRRFPGMTPPSIRMEEQPNRPVRFSKRSPPRLRETVDITLIGTAVAAVIHEALTRGSGRLVRWRTVRRLAFVLFFEKIRRECIRC